MLIRKNPVASIRSGNALNPACCDKCPTRSGLVCLAFRKIGHEFMPIDFDTIVTDMLKHQLKSRLDTAPIGTVEAPEFR